MKYGIIYYKDTDNLGDDIQTYAAKQFLPKIDYYIDREDTYAFIPNKKENVAVIANGWYLHKKFTFPFSPYIHPLLISMHFSKNDLITEPGYEFLNEYTKEKLKPYFPIGCRDNETLEELKKLGYDAYFSGCMTLTIDKIKNTKKQKNKYICAVDLNKKCLDYLKSITDIEIKEMTHWVEKDYHKLSFDERMNRVKEVLSIYQNASLVITDRLHVALPCLALETNVSLIYYEYNSDRLKTFTNYVNTLSEEEFLNINIEKLLNKKNPCKHLEIRNNLKKKCKHFISNTNITDISSLPEIEFYRESIQRQKHVEKMFLSKIKNLKEENEQLKHELNAINNSRSWRIVKRVINLRKKVTQ